MRANLTDRLLQHVQTAAHRADVLRNALAQRHELGGREAGKCDIGHHKTAAAALIDQTDNAGRIRWHYGGHDLWIDQTSAAAVASSRCGGGGAIVTQCSIVDVGGVIVAAAAAAATGGGR